MRSPSATNSVNPRGAKRLGLVTIGQMVAALVHAVEEPARGLRVMEVPQIQQYPRADYQRAAAR